ncbi:MAG: alpha/beta hydrolase [Dehalococcoidia bacterium]
MPWVDVNGIDIRYIEEGEGPPLVFLHGNSSCSVAWERQFEAFAAHFRCIAYDSVNHGFSANSPRDAEEPDRADELEGFLAALGIEQPVLAGNSMGGNTILRWAARHPDAARALIISGSGVRPPGDAMPAERRPMDVETLYVPFGASFTPEFEAQQPEQHERYFRIRSTATRLEALRHPRRPAARTVEERAAMMERVTAIASPMQIITGELDSALAAA